MKEFLEEVIKCGFNADYGLMTSTADGLAYPRPSADKVEFGVQLLEFLGGRGGGQNPRVLQTTGLDEVLILL